MENAIINGVHQIANAIYKKQGYAITISKADVTTVLQAYILLQGEIKNYEENPDK